MKWIEHLQIYWENVSPYYFWSFILTILIVVFNICLDLYNKTRTTRDFVDNINNTATTTKETVIDRSENDVLYPELSVKYKRKSTDALYNSHSLSETQLKKERETEAQQLAAILKLMQKQQDKFQMTSMAEVEEQLKIYR